MKNYNGHNLKKNFFEGWYLKNQNHDESISFIPSYSIDDKGRRTLFIQVITKNKSYFFDLTGEGFYAKERSFYCSIGENVFCEKGIKISLESKELSIKGKLYYKNIHNIKSDIMGPFRFVPFLQCNHGVVSMGHEIKGNLIVNGREWNFNGGKGYIEKDWGNSFPKSYFWTQCNLFKNRDCCIMLSVADIPFGLYSFMGCICSIIYNGKEYRMATYSGVKILKYTKDEVIIKQGSYMLFVNRIGETEEKHFEKTITDSSVADKNCINTGFDLKAPVKGNMNRIIKENLECKIKYKFMKNKRIIFEIVSDRASIETVNLKN